MGASPAGGRGFRQLLICRRPRAIQEAGAAPGGVAERFKARVLKTREGVTLP